MSDQPSVTNFPMSHVDPAKQIKAGDMAVIVRLDGTISTLAFEANVDLLKKDPETLDDAELDELECIVNQGETVFALTLAATNSLLMKILKDVASNPDLVNLDEINKAAQRAARPN